MANWTFILVSLLFVALETNCFSVQNGNVPRTNVEYGGYPPYNTGYLGRPYNDDSRSSEERFRYPYLRNIYKGSVLDKTFNDSSEEDHSSEERFTVSHPLNLAKRSVLNKIHNDSSEEDHSRSSEERFRASHLLNLAKRSVLIKIYNDSTEEDNSRSSSEERFRASHPLNIVKRSVLNEIHNDSSEEDHSRSSEEKFRASHPLNLTKRSVLNKIYNDSSEEDHSRSSEERFRTSRTLNLAKRQAPDQSSEESDESDSNEKTAPSSYSVQTSNAHVQRRDVNGINSHYRKPLKNLREASEDYLDEVLYTHGSNEDKEVVSNIPENNEETYDFESDEDSDLFDDVDTEELGNNKELYDKYIDEIAKKYGYKSGEDNEDDHIEETIP